MEAQATTLHLQLPTRTAAAIGKASLPIQGPASDQSVFATIAATGEYEPHVMDVITDRLPPGGVFVDVGANIGVLSAVAAWRVGARGRVLAIEASPLTYQFLLANVASPDLSQVTAMNQGVWDAPATLTLRHVPEGPGWSSFSAVTEVDTGLPVAVPCDTLDALVAQAELVQLDLLKIDVEGSELRVLRGAANTLARFKPAVIVELNPDTLARLETSAQELYRCLQENGYRMLAIARDGGLTPLSSYADLDALFRQGQAWVDVLAEPEA